MENGKVISLDAYIDRELGVLAKAAYNARRKAEAASEHHLAAMIAFTKACDRLNVDPAKLTIGEYSGVSFYSVACGKRGKRGKR